MKIRVKLEVVTSERIVNIDTSDICINDEVWNKLSDEKKKEIIQEYVDDNFDNPIWNVDAIIN